jgi:putative tricarboxylic transport membrane protein
MVFCFIGAFSLRNNFFDLWTAAIFGFAGYFMKKLDIPATPMVLCLILGSPIESLFRQSLAMSGGSLKVFVRGPFSISLLVLTVLLLAVSLWQRSRISKLAEDSD